MLSSARDRGGIGIRIGMWGNERSEWEWECHDENGMSEIRDYLLYCVYVGTYTSGQCPSAIHLQSDPRVWRRLFATSSALKGGNEVSEKCPGSQIG
jgi:hypothetical protein